MKKRFTTFLTVFLLCALNVRAQAAEPLKLLETIPLPGLKEGDFDHFAVDLTGHRLFLAYEKNTAVGVFDLRTNKLIHTITDVKEPHSMVYRADLKKLFLVDGGVPEVRVYQGSSYKYLGGIKLEEDCDSMAYDPVTKYMYVDNGGKGAHMPYAFISIVDTTRSKKLADIKIDSASIEALALEKSGPRLFVNITGKNAVGVIDREKRTLIATWSIAPEATYNVPMAYDEAGHRLFLGTSIFHSTNPGKLVVLDSDSGKIVTSLPSVVNPDDMAYDFRSKRIYIAGDGFVDVFQQNDADHYELIGHIPTAFRAKTAILVPQLNRYYVAAPHHGDKEAEVLVYQTVL